MTNRKWALRFHAFNLSWDNCVKTTEYFNSLEALVAEHARYVTEYVIKRLKE